MSAAARDVNEPTAPMPLREDYTLMSWAGGFPGHTPGAPWRRVIQTGRYALALDTDTLRIPHLGPVIDAPGYSAAASGDDRPWQGLPPADLNLTITADGSTYRCTAGGRWTQFAGPRLIESGRFMQRADVTDLVFTAADGTALNVEARFETVAWPDRLALILAARPGMGAIPAGEACFGRSGGGFGFDGTNHLEIPHSPELDPARFTLELWAFLPKDFAAATRAFPWLVCKNPHEEADGNYGITILGSKLQARMNIGGGRQNRFSVDARSDFNTEAWNHLAMSYDGGTLRLYLNGELSGEQPIGRQRVPGRGALAFGRRQDNSGDGYHFRGALDEIRLYDRPLTAEEIRTRFKHPETAIPTVEPVREWTFRQDGPTSLTRSAERWTKAAMDIALTTPDGTLRGHWSPPGDTSWSGREWRETSLAFDPVLSRTCDSTGVPQVTATELPGGRTCPVATDPVRGWQRINLDGIEPIVPPGGGRAPQNDAIERVKLTLVNPTHDTLTARLMFEKTGGGIRQRIGSPITGLSAILRHPDGSPSGIPVQLSKNWHGLPEGGVYAGAWFHGFSQVRLPPNATVELELTIAYGHWGGVAAASHAQLCLIGWGSNQLWNESALGSWGESICYEPDQVQADCTILDVRPLMVRSMTDDQLWSWTHNVGGGDFLRLFDPAGRRLRHVAMRTAYLRQGPCLTEVTYAGRIGSGIRHRATVSLARTDDVVRGTYRLRMDVTDPMDFSRFVIFQIGSDSYSYTGERKMALGNETGLTREWSTQWGGDTYRTEPVACGGRAPWVSLHEAVSRAGQEASNKGRSGAPGAWANRGLVIRAWRARLGGKPAGPWMAEHGVRVHGMDTSTVDLVPPPGVTRLLPGDFVEATFEHLVMPKFAADYYGPNEALRAALREHGNTWRMIHREACGNERLVTAKTGTLVGTHPAVEIRAVENAAEFTLTGGLGYVPLTITGLTTPRVGVLAFDGVAVNQGVHGADFWQCDYDPESGTWSRTYNLAIADAQPHLLRFTATPE